MNWPLLVLKRQTSTLHEMLLECSCSCLSSNVVFAANQLETQRTVELRVSQPLVEGLTDPTDSGAREELCIPIHINCTMKIVYW